MKRRDFLQVVAMSAISTGCGKENAKLRQAVGGVMEIAGELIVLLPHPAARVVAVALMSLGKVFQVDFETLTGDTDYYTSPPLTEKQRRLAQRHSRVTVRYRDSRDQELERILFLERKIRQLESRLEGRIAKDSVGGSLHVRYRLYRQITKEVGLDYARRMGSNLTRLGVPWRGQDYSNGHGLYSVVTYGPAPQWQELLAASRSQAQDWADELISAGFEVSVYGD